MQARSSAGDRAGPAAEGPLDAVVQAGDNGFSLGHPTTITISISSGIIQGDGRFFTSGDDKNGGSTFFLNRVRPILTGSLGEYYNFNITPDSARAMSVAGAYMNFTYWTMRA